MVLEKRFIVPRLDAKMTYICILEIIRETWLRDGSEKGLYI